MQPPPAPRIEFWHGLTPYAEAVSRMEAAVAEVMAGGGERIFFCEHEPVITLGSSAGAADAAGIRDIPVVESGRGGKATWHGPGQRVVYLVVRLDRWGKDVRAYVRWLQEWLASSLQELGINAYITDDIGVWVEGGTGPEKIAAVGIRVRRGVAYHGISLNVGNDLGVYRRFVPCGLADKGVARVADRVAAADGAGLMAQVDEVLRKGLLHMPPLPR